MNEELGHVSGLVSGFGIVNTLPASIFNPEDITGITIANEVNQSPCRPATGGVYSVNSAKT